jgi:hypothetical protein
VLDPELWRLCTVSKKQQQIEGLLAVIVVEYEEMSSEVMATSLLAPMNAIFLSSPARLAYMNLGLDTANAGLQLEAGPGWICGQPQISESLQALIFCSIGF